MAEYGFERESRTANSEGFVITADGADFGRVDLHFTTSNVFATMCVPSGTAEETIQDLIGEIDERLVLTADLYREDLVVTVWEGRQVGVYSEEESLEEEEEEEEESGSNGYH